MLEYFAKIDFWSSISFLGCVTSVVGAIISLREAAKSKSIALAIQKQIGQIRQNWKTTKSQKLLMAAESIQQIISPYCQSMASSQRRGLNKTDDSMKIRAKLSEIYKEKHHFSENKNERNFIDLFYQQSSKELELFLKSEQENESEPALKLHRALDQLNAELKSAVNEGILRK